MPSFTGNNASVDLEPSNAYSGSRARGKGSRTYGRKNWNKGKRASKGNYKNNTGRGQGDGFVKNRRSFDKRKQRRSSHENRKNFNTQNQRRSSQVNEKSVNNQNQRRNSYTEIVQNERNKNGTLVHNPFRAQDVRTTNTYRGQKNRNGYRGKTRWSQTIKVKTRSSAQEIIRNNTPPSQSYKMGKDTYLVKVLSSGSAQHIEHILFTPRFREKLISSINVPGCKGLTPLMAAAKNKNCYPKSFAQVIRLGAYVNAAMKTGATALHFAAKAQEESSTLGKTKAYFLLRNGAYVNAPDNVGNTPLHHAAQNANADMVKFLMANGADVNAKNKFGFCALHFACYSNLYAVDSGLIMFLLEQGANPTDKTVFGKSPLTIAAQRGDICAISGIIAKSSSDEVDTDALSFCADQDTKWFLLRTIRSRIFKEFRASLFSKMPILAKHVKIKMQLRTRKIDKEPRGPRKRFFY